MDEMNWFLGKTDDVHGNTWMYMLVTHLYISVSLATCLLFSRDGQLNCFRALVRHLSSLVLVLVTKHATLRTDSKSHGVELSRFSSRYDDDLDEVEEEDHFEDVDDLEVSFLAIIF